MAFVYPVHVMIDHSGLFDHQNHTHHHKGHDHSDERAHTDDELCALCLTYSSMELTESVHPEPACIDGQFFDATVQIGCNKPENLTDARAPPAGLLI